MEEERNVCAAGVRLQLPGAQQLRGVGRQVKEMRTLRWFAWLETSSGWLWVEWQR